MAQSRYATLLYCPIRLSLIPLLGINHVLFILNIFVFNISSYNIDWLLCSIIAMLAESNRVPFDISEAESELVAGFSTEYSSIYFSIIILTEYINIIPNSFWIIVLSNLIMFIFT